MMMVWRWCGGAVREGGESFCTLLAHWVRLPPVRLPQTRLPDSSDAATRRHQCAPGRSIECSTSPNQFPFFVYLHKQITCQLSATSHQIRRQGLPRSPSVLPIALGKPVLF